MVTLYLLVVSVCQSVSHNRVWKMPQYEEAKCRCSLDEVLLT
jgi:hypothetical protein